jgi:ABC-type phosphate transport system permease subunit
MKLLDLFYKAMIIAFPLAVIFAIIASECAAP